MCEAIETDIPSVQKKMCQFCPFGFRKKWKLVALIEFVHRWKCHKSNVAFCRGHYDRNKESYGVVDFVDDKASHREKLAAGDIINLSVTLNGRKQTYSERIKP
ncbi:MAG: hypothetical protein KDA17_07395 [Candidatus Saccharibacteria bacterium]|nr:hypothetical protein [Candidatus Saccharibacteria bacterium]